MPVRIELSPDEILALYTIQQLPPEEQAFLEEQAETLASKTGITIVDAIVVLMKIGQKFAVCRRLFR